MGGEYEHEGKVAARVDREIYDKVQKHFHHGQQTQLIRNIFESLSILSNENRFEEVMDYMYKGTELVLPKLQN